RTRNPLPRATLAAKARRENGALAATRRFNRGRKRRPARQQRAGRSRGGTPRNQAWAWCSALRLRVAAAFLAEAERSAAERCAEWAPPILPPRLADTLVSFLPRPEPDLLPPPLSL